MDRRRQSRAFQLRATLIRNSRTEKAMRNDEMVMIMFVVAQEGLA